MSKRIWSCPKCGTKIDAEFIVDVENAINKLNKRRAKKQEDTKKEAKLDVKLGEKMIADEQGKTSP